MHAHVERSKLIFTCFEFVFRLKARVNWCERWRCVVVSFVWNMSHWWAIVCLNHNRFGVIYICNWQFQFICSFKVDTFALALSLWSPRIHTTLHEFGYSFNLIRLACCFFYFFVWKKCTRWMSSWIIKHTNTNLCGKKIVAIYSGTKYRRQTMRRKKIIQRTTLSHVPGPFDLCHIQSNELPHKWCSMFLHKMQHKSMQIVQTMHNPFILS